MNVIYGCKISVEVAFPTEAKQSTLLIHRYQCTASKIAPPQNFRHAARLSGTVFLILAQGEERAR